MISRRCASDLVEMWTIYDPNEPDKEEEFPVDGHGQCDYVRSWSRCHYNNGHADCCLNEEEKECWECDCEHHLVT